MEWSYILCGALIGLVFGVPLGAVGALCIQRTLERGVFMGFVPVSARPRRISSTPRSAFADLI